MKKYNLILLAGGEQQSLYEVTGIKNKAQIRIHGKPMIGWVLDAFSRCGKIADIVVAGPQELAALSCMKGVRKRVPGGHSALESLANAVGYVKARLSSDEDSVHRGYLISFGDAVFLDQAIISEMLSNIERCDADIVLHYVERASIVRAGLNAKRTFIPIGSGLYTGTTIYYIRRFRDIAKCIVHIAKLRKYRKQPAKLLQVLGCAGLDMPQIEKRLSDELSVELKIFTIDHPEAGMDVDKPSDLALAQEWLSPGTA